MTKADLIDALYEKVGLSKKESSQIVELIFELIRQSLESNEKVKISGFGNFNIRSKNVRRGRNPQTGEEIKISARSVLTFKASPVLKKALNG
jgi:integration host factor subunit alpha